MRILGRSPGTRSVSRAVTAFIATVSSALSWGAITGTVFQDYNGNGLLDTAGTAGAIATDKGIAGVTVTAYGASNTSCGTATTAAAGTYSITLSSTTGNCAGPTYRVEFTTLPALFLPSAKSTASVAGGTATQAGSATQFVANGATNVNLAANIPCDYCEDNPLLSTSRLVAGSATAAAPAAFTFPYNAGSASGVGAGKNVPTTHALEFDSNAVGTVWGQSYARSKKTVFFAAFQKRHASYSRDAADTAGINNSGRIFYGQRGTTTTPSLLVDLDVLIGANTSKPAGNNHTSPSAWINDLDAYGRVGRVGFGDIAVSRDESLLYAVNLNDKKIYKVPLSSPVSQVTSAASVTSVDMITLANVGTGATGCASAADLIPGAINVNRYTGDVFFSLTCVAAGTTGINDPDKLRGFVYRWNGAAATATEVANFPLNFPRNCLSSPVGDVNICPANSDGEWLPWSDNIADLRTVGTTFGQASRPQPWIMNIDFDQANNMILGFIDRAGHQTGNNNSGGGNVGSTEGISGGDTIRLAASTTVAGQGTWAAFNGTEIYPGDTFSGGYHGETTLGGLAYVPGANTVVVSAFDPVDSVRSGGIMWFNNADGAKTRNYETFGTDVSASFGKAAGMGDVELLCDPAPIEIGNRVWMDTNGNGVQDPDEMGIQTVTVQLYDPATMSVVGTATTDVNGEYYFNGTNVGGGVKPNTNYVIRILNASGGSQQAALVGKTLTVANSNGDGVAGSGVSTNDSIADARDNDATAVGTNAEIAYNTGAAGNNNHSLDFGFTTPKYSIGDLVWNDTNNNGKIDGAETPLNGVRVEVFAATAAGAPTGPSLRTVTTDATGRYRFDDLVAGEYVVVATPPAGYVSSTGTAVTTGAVATDELDNGLDTKIASGTGAGGFPSAKIVLGPANSEPTSEASNTSAVPAGSIAGAGGEAPDARSDRTVDFGFYQPFDLKITKAITSAGPYIEGSTVTFTLQAENLGPGSASGAIVVKDKLPAGLVGVSAIGTNWTCTNAVGAGVEITCNRAAAAGVLAGSGATAQASLITVTATIAVGATGTLTNKAQVNPDPADAAKPELIPLGTTDTGYDDGTNATGSNNDDSKSVAVGALTYSIGDLVWNDANNNGKIDGAEVPLSGATVQLFAATAGNPSGTALGSVTTDATGRYRFDALAAGDYVVVVTLPAGYVSSTGTAVTAGAVATDELDNGLDTKIASGVGAGGFRSAVVTLGPSSSEPTGEKSNTSTVPASGISGAGGEAPDARSDRTVDFGFYQPFDLKITKAITSAGPYTEGSTVTFTLRAENLGPGPASGAIIVKDKLPAGLVGVSAVGTNWTCTNAVGAGVEITCNRAAAAGVLAGSGATAQASLITVTATIAAGATGSLVNKAQVNPDPADAAKPELIPLGTTDTGYDDGTNATGSNNDDSKSVAVGATTYAIGNRVWLDTNNNGVVDAGEVGLDGVAVRLVNTTTSAVVSTSTASGGYYLFPGLAAGTYKVEITPPAGYVTSTGSNGSATGPYEAGSSDFTLAGDNKDHGTKMAGSNVVMSAPITVGPGLQPTGEAAQPGSTDTTPDDRTNLTVDFGLFAPASLGTVVWIDNGNGGGTANDGIKQASEPGIPGVTVRLLNGSGQPILDAAGVAVTTTTDQFGNYGFGNLIAGSYQVEFVFPASAVLTNTINPTGAGNPPTNPSAGGADAQRNEMNPTTRRTPVITLAAGSDNPNLDSGVRSYDAAPAPTNVPTLNEWMLMLLAMLVVGLASPALRRK
jgi:uncharacterized repeat protein (TIGR01451 family)